MVSELVTFEDALSQTPTQSPQRRNTPPSQQQQQQKEIQSSSSSSTIIKATFITSLGGILFGYDMGVITTALPQITTSFSLTSIQRESVVGLLYLGGALGALIGGTICDIKGRRTTIILTDGVFIIGALVLGLSQNVTTLWVGRLVVGFGVSLSGIADVAYLHEISPKRMRGSLVSCNEACISLGFLLAYVVGYFFTGMFPEEGWRVMFGISGVVAVLQMAGMMFLPESPVWLASHGRSDEARQAFLQIYGTHEHKKGSRDNSSLFSAELEMDIDDESLINIFGITTHSKINYSLFDRVRSLCNNITEFFREMRNNLRQTIITVFLASTQQFCGHPNVLNFAPEIFSQAGFGTQSSLTSTLLLGLNKFLITIIVIWEIETIGRRPLLLGGMSLITASLLVLTITFWNGTDENISNAPLAFLGAMGVVMGYAGSFGPLTWLLTSEMFPGDIRGRALGLSTVTSHLCASMVSFTFLSGQQASLGGQAAPFALYFVVMSLSTVFAWLSIPETKNKDPIEIENDIKNMWMWRVACSSRACNIDFVSEKSEEQQARISRVSFALL